MAIANYGDLKSSVATYLNRSDLAGYIPDFIRLAERRIAYGSDDPYPSQALRIPAMQNRSTGTAGTISYPTGFLELIRLRIENGSVYWTADYASPAEFTRLENEADLPQVYTFLNNAIQTAGYGGATYTMDYYKAFTALSADADTNWLLTNAPDAYLFGALLESSPFIMDMPMIQAWFGMFKSIISALNKSTKYKAPGSLYVRSATAGP